MAAPRQDNGLAVSPRRASWNHSRWFPRYFVATPRKPDRNALKRPFRLPTVWMWHVPRTRGAGSSAASVTRMESFATTGRSASAVSAACAPAQKARGHPAPLQKNTPEGGHFCTLIDIPVTKRSGRIILVRRRLAANRRLADAACHWAMATIQRDAASRAICHALRSRGHAQALRSVADRFLNVVCKMIETGQTSDPERRSKAAPLNQKKRLTLGCVPPDCFATNLLFALASAFVTGFNGMQRRPVRTCLYMASPFGRTRRRLTIGDMRRNRKTMPLQCWKIIQPPC